MVAAYGGVFIATSLLWGVAFDDFQPDRADILGAIVCLVGVPIIMHAREANRVRGGRRYQRSEGR